MNEDNETKIIGYINIPPPSWETVFNWVKNGTVNNLEVLHPAIEIADLVMKAQQENAKSITFKFDGNKIVSWETE